MHLRRIEPMCADGRICVLVVYPCGAFCHYLFVISYLLTNLFTWHFYSEKPWSRIYFKDEKENVCLISRKRNHSWSRTNLSGIRESLSTSKKFVQLSPVCWDSFRWNMKGMKWWLISYHYKRNHNFLRMHIAWWHLECQLINCLW